MTLLYVKSAVQTLSCKAMHRLLQNKLFSFATSLGCMNSVSWHRLTSKHVPPGSMQVIKVIGFHFESLSFSELNTSKNQSSFLLYKIFLNIRPSYQPYVS